MSIAQQLFERAFATERTPRSHAYRLGVMACLQSKETKVSILPPRYNPGQPEYDAFYAGVSEGNAIWRQHVEEHATADYAMRSIARNRDGSIAALLRGKEKV